jgi:hypothetical protein
MDEDVASGKRKRSVSPTTVIGPTTERPQKRRRRGHVKDEGDENVLAHPRGPLSRVAQKRERKRARKVARNAAGVAGAGAMDIDEWEGLIAFGM